MTSVFVVSGLKKEVCFFGLFLQAGQNSTLSALLITNAFFCVWIFLNQFFFLLPLHETTVLKCFTSQDYNYCWSTTYLQHTFIGFIIAWWHLIQFIVGLFVLTVFILLGSICDEGEGKNNKHANETVCDSNRTIINDEDIFCVVICYCIFTIFTCIYWYIH